MRTFQVRKDVVGVFESEHVDLLRLEGDVAQTAAEVVEKEYPDNGGYMVTITIEARVLKPVKMVPCDHLAQAEAIPLDGLFYKTEGTPDRGHAFDKRRLQHLRKHGFQTVGDVLKVLRERDDVRGRWITTNDLIRIQTALEMGHGLDVEILVGLTPKEG